MFLGLAAVGAALAMAVVATPFPGMTLRITMEELFPAVISWDGKTAWRRCDSAIAGQTAWPSAPGAACAAMQLCANEAPLLEPQRRRLSQAMHDTPGCPEP
jgi:hypothetical protein